MVRANAHVHTFKLVGWGLSRSRFNMGTSNDFGSPLIYVRPVSADLVPVFSFGENDVRLFALTVNL